MKMDSPEFRLRVLREMGLAPVWIRRDHPESPVRVPDVQESFAMALPARVSGSETATAGADDALRSRRIATLDWQTLESEVSACQACPLGASRRQAVYGVGVLEPVWLFVGEAPGAEEDARGEPFVGEAGRLLDNMFKALGIERHRDLYIANVLKCRPPQNRNPEVLEVARCSPYLSRQIELLAPRIIVALGRFAAESVLGVKATVGSLRGRVHEVAVGENAWPVVVTYHPAYLLRNLADKRKAWADLCLARQALRLRGA